MHQRQGFSETPGIGRGGDVTYDLATDGKFGTVLHNIVVIRNDTEEFHFLFAFKFKQALLHCQDRKGRETIQATLGEL